MSTATTGATTRVQISELIPLIDEFVKRQYETYPNGHAGYTRECLLASGHNRVCAFDNIMEEVRVILASILMKMSHQNSWTFMKILRDRELRLLNKGLRSQGFDPIDLHDFDPYLTDERV